MRSCVVFIFCQLLSNIATRNCRVENSDRGKTNSCTNVRELVLNYHYFLHENYVHTKPVKRRPPPWSCHNNKRRRHRCPTYSQIEENIYEFGVDGMTQEPSVGDETSSPMDCDVVFATRIFCFLTLEKVRAGGDRNEYLLSGWLY